MTGKVPRCLLIFMLIAPLAFVGHLRAQIAQGAIVGTVTDPSGAVLAGASVTTTNVATGVVSRTSTTSVGYYDFPALPPGSYTVAIEQNGFKRVVTAPTVLHAGDTDRIDVKMVVGSATQAVEVTGAPPLLNATTTNVGTVIQAHEISQLPLNGRSFMQLLSLQPGWNNGTSGANRGGAQLNGMSGLGNNFLLDGVDMSFGENNGVGLGAVGGGGMLIDYVSIDAVEEMKASSGAASAEYSRASGGTVNLTTKSGTNQFHGAAWEYIRNDAFDTSTYFSNLNHLSKPELRQNQFGGNIGGPFLRNKLFFFFNYEGARVIRGTTISGTVPTQQLLNQISNPTLVDYIQRWAPLPTSSTTSPLAGLYYRNAAQNDTEDTTLTRIDGDFGKSHLNFRMVHNNSLLTNPQLSLKTLQYFPLPTRNYEAAWIYTISPTMVNQVRFGYNSNPIARHTAAIDHSLDTLTPGIGYLTTEQVTLAVTGLSTIQPLDSLAANAPTKSFIDNLTWVRGEHTITVGMQYRRTDAKRVQYGQGVWYRYNSISHMMQDTVDTLSLDFGNPGKAGMNFGTYDGYVQDSWKANRHLLVNAGLHYSYFQVLKGPIGFATSDPFGPTTPLGTPLWNAKYADFAPTLGLVYDLTGNGRTIASAGYGMYYGAAQPFYNFDSNWLAANVPAFPTVSPSDLPPSLSPKFDNINGTFLDQVRNDPSTAPQGLAGGIQAPDPNHHDEYSEQWNASLERQLTASMMVKGSYVGNRVLHLYSSALENPIDPSSGTRPYANIGPVWLATYGARLWNNELQLTFRKTTSHGLAFDVFYTYGKSMEYDSGDQNFSKDTTTQDFNNIAGSIGPTNGQVAHRLSADYVYEIPTQRLTGNSLLMRGILGNWSLEGILGAHSGGALNVVTGRDAVGNGRPDGQRPDTVPGISPYLHGSNRLQFLNPAAFDTTTVLAQKRFGNLGYDTVSGPGGFTWDTGVHKTWKIYENHALTFRFEMFNMMNHVVFGNPNTTTTSPTFGRITSGSSGRQLQFALRYSF